MRGCPQGHGPRVGKTQQRGASNSGNHTKTCGRNLKTNVTWFPTYGCSYAFRTAFMTVTLTRITWSLTVVLICISLMAGEMEYFCMFINLCFIFREHANDEEGVGKRETLHTGGGFSRKLKVVVSHDPATQLGISQRILGQHITEILAQPCILQQYSQ